jgi:hypothetical protein
MRLLGGNPGLDSPAPANGTKSSVDRAMEAYEQESLTQVTVIRTAMFAVVQVWLLVNYGRDVALEQGVVLTGFIALGLLA